MPVPLLMTKLYIPFPGKYLVHRARLIEKLDQCLEPGCRLTLVSAPAGFGKTSLVSAWAANAKALDARRVVAWLSIDAGDNDPVTFWNYVIAALQVHLPEVGEKTLSLLSEQGPDLEGKLAFLINDLHQISQPCVLVLDDYHLIRSPVIHQSLAFFTEHAPLHMHLLIASRTDPPLPMALLRGRGQLLEIRLSDLRFSDEDADSYLNAHIGLNLNAPSVRALNQKTEGWIAGLQMAALAMQDLGPHDHTSGQEKAAGFITSFSGSNRFILDYLIEEVLNRQPEPVQRFLIYTSILDRLCGPLCDALLQGGEEGSSNAQATLEYLESCNLFIFPMDQQRCWYRYHQLFADLLRKHLAQTAPGAAADLHRRAVQWYEENGLITNAIWHAFQIPDEPKAAALVAQVTEVMWGRGEHATLLAWMNALPDVEKRSYPSLLTFQVSMLISAGKLQEAEACIPILEEYIASVLQTGTAQSALMGNVAALRTYIASFYRDWPALYAHAQTALQNLTRDEDAGQRCGVSLVLANAFLTEGKLEDAGQAFAEAIDAGKKSRKPAMMLTGYANLAMVRWLQGNLGSAAQVCQEGRKLIEQYHFDRSPMAVDLQLTWGVIRCEQGALDEAEPVINQALAVALEQKFIWPGVWGYQAQARLLLARGDWQGAEAVVQSALQLAEMHEVPARLSCLAAGLLAKIWLHQGKTSQVAHYLNARNIQPDGEIQFPRQSEYLALARLQWMQGDVDEAFLVLDRILQWAELQQQTGTLLGALLLKAILLQSKGKLPQSLSLLERALALAEQGEYIQAFVEEGKPMAVLLREALSRGRFLQVARQLLAAFPDDIAEESGVSFVEPEPSRPVSSQIIPLVEPLSRREMETLRLIAEGYSNKEIAQRLFISLRTVKYYSTGLYNKLGVDSRMQAVNRARELGLL